MDSLNNRRAGLAEVLVGRPMIWHWSARLPTAGFGGEALLFFGEPGIGKTALLDAAAGVAAEAGIWVLRADGVEFEADLAFSALHQALLPLGRVRANGRRAPGCAERRSGFGEGPPPDRLLVSNATLTVLRQAAAASPV